MQACRAVTKNGTACTKPARTSGLCLMHEDPDRAKVLGSLGGKQNRRRSVDLEIPEGALAMADLRNLTETALRKLLAGELSAKNASAFSQLCNLLLKMHPTATLEAEVARLQQQLAEMEMQIQTDHQLPSLNTEREHATGERTGGTEAGEAAPVLPSRGRNGHGNHN